MQALVHLAAYELKKFRQRQFILNIFKNEIVKIMHEWNRLNFVSRYKKHKNMIYLKLEFG